MFSQRGGNFRPRQRIELVEEKYGCAGVLAAAAFPAKFVANFAAGDQDALCVLHFMIRNDWQKARPRKILNVRAGVRMAQHALRRENDQRLAPGAQGLPPQHVKILRGRGRLADLQIVFGRQLHKALDARARMLRALAFIPMRQQKHQAAWQIPFVFRGA